MARYLSRWPREVAVFVVSFVAASMIIGYRVFGDPWHYVWLFGGFVVLQWLLRSPSRPGEVSSAKSVVPEMSPALPYWLTAVSVGTALLVGWFTKSTVVFVVLAFSGYLGQSVFDERRRSQSRNGVAG